MSASPTAIPEKINNEMPLPMPRSVICSPSHIRKAVPVVKVRIVMKRNAQPGVSTKGIPEGLVVRSSVMAIAEP